MVEIYELVLYFPGSQGIRCDICGDSNQTLSYGATPWGCGIMCDACYKDAMADQ